MDAQLLSELTGTGTPPVRDDGGGSAIMVKIASFKYGKVYLAGHGVMTPEFMEVVGSDFEELLEEGCPLEE